MYLVYHRCYELWSPVAESWETGPYPMWLFSIPKNGKAKIRTRFFSAGWRTCYSDINSSARLTGLHLLFSLAGRHPHNNSSRLALPCFR